MSSWKPNHGTAFKRKEHFSLSDGDVIARILPQPKGSYAEYRSVWHKFHAVHFGYKNIEGKHRMFESPLVKNNKTKMIEKPDAALERLNDFKAKLEQAKIEKNVQAESALNSLVGMKGIYNIDNNEHMNVILLDGRIGELKIRYKAMVALKAEIKRLQDGSPDEPGFDPLSFENGRFFVFSRSVAGRDTTFSVREYKEKVTLEGIGKVERSLVHRVTPELEARLELEGFDLQKLFQTPTSEEVAQIVAESDLRTGKSPACNRIFDERWKAERAAKDAAKALESGGPVQGATAPAAGSQAMASGDGNERPEDDGPEEASVTSTLPAADRKLGPAAQATQPAATQPASKAAPKASENTTQGQAISDLSDADFFKQIGVTA
jgi:hypothetical protein